MSKAARCAHPVRLAQSAPTASPLSLREYIDEVAHDLHRRVEHQRWLCRRLTGHAEGADADGAFCPLPDCPRLKRYRQAMRETIDVLEQTKTAFKSKRLEVIRHKLTRLLAGD